MVTTPGPRPGRPPRRWPAVLRMRAGARSARSTSRWTSSVASRGKADRIRHVRGRELLVACECFLIRHASPEGAREVGTHRVVPEDVRTTIAVEVLHIGNVVAAHR